MATSFSVEQLLIKESGRIGPDIYRKTVDTSPWLKLVNQDVWPDEMGDSVSVLVYERSLPYNYDGDGKLTGTKTTWNPLTGNAANGVLGAAGEGGPNGVGQSFAAGSSNVIEFGQRLRSYGLKASSLNSPDMSLNDLRFPLKRKEQLSNIMAILSEATGEAWKERYYDEYVRLAENKFVATTNASGAVGLTSANSSDVELFGTVTSGNIVELAQTHLDKMYLRMVRDGGGANAYGRQNGAPVFLLVTSYEVSDSLIKANGTSGQTATRDDFRWSDRANELLGPLGVQRTYKGFHHLVDPFPRRFTYASNTWTRVFPFKKAATTANNRTGVKYDINPDYETADFEESIIFHPDVFTSLVPKPISATGDMDFSAQTYRGEFTWRNIPDRQYNPDGGIGFFRAVFASGSKPIFPNLGYVIRHKRINPVV
jgi:hypothetical protein